MKLQIKTLYETTIEDIKNTVNEYCEQSDRVVDVQFMQTFYENRFEQVLPNMYVAFIKENVDE